MKKILLSIGLLLGLNSYSQTETLIAYDYIETFDWAGAWFIPASTTGYYSNLSVTPTNSAVLYGGGNNAYEFDWYSLPNIQVDPTKDHIFRMRLAAQDITNFGSTPAGLDQQDYIVVQLSTDGGNTYVDEIQITGKSNAVWDYNPNGVAWKVADGLLTTYTPAQGGDRTNTGDGYSVIELYIPQGETDIAIDVFTRANRMGEDWWMDNFELFEITDNGLPVELSYFGGMAHLESNLIEWTTQSEYNSDYFSLERSFSGENWEEIAIISSAGNSTSEINYSYQDYELSHLSYYRLKQVDIDGQYEIFGPIAITRKEGLKIVKYTNLLGQEIDPLVSKGIIIEIYEDKSIRKVFKP
jgi:hypothetical protein